MDRKIRRKIRDKYVLEAIRSNAEDILRSREFNSSAKNIQNGNMSVRQHSINVAKTSVKISRMIPVQFKEREIIRGALLHDYFLYDWHDNHTTLHDILHFYKMHGFSHPGTALKNASREFDLTLREEETIRKHMWPLTIVPPTCREAWIVTLADKYCSLLETLRIHRGDKRG